MFFFADGISVNRRGGKLCVAHPLLQHVQRDDLHHGIDPEAVPRALRAAVRRVSDFGFDHYALHDLPDPDTRQRPDRYMRQLARFLRFSDAVGGVQSIENLWRLGNSAVKGFLFARAVFALLERSDGHGSAGQVYA